MLVRLQYLVRRRDARKRMSPSTTVSCTQRRSISNDMANESKVTVAQGHGLSAQGHGQYAHQVVESTSRLIRGERTPTRIRNHAHDERVTPVNQQRDTNDYYDENDYNDAAESSAESYDPEAVCSRSVSIVRADLTKDAKGFNKVCSNE